MGDITLSPVPGEGVTATFPTGSDPALVYKQFAASSFSNKAEGTSRDAAHGAVVLSVVVKPGSSATLSIVFAWHFPDRDF